MSSVSMKKTTSWNTMSIIGVMFMTVSSPSETLTAMRGLLYGRVGPKEEVPFVGGGQRLRGSEGLPAAEPVRHVFQHAAEVHDDLDGLVPEELIEVQRGHGHDQPVERGDQRRRDAGREVRRGDLGAEAH